MSKKNEHNRKITIVNAFTNHSSEKIQNLRLFDEHFIQYHPVTFIQKKQKEKMLISKKRKLIVKG